MDKARSGDCEFYIDCIERAVKCSGEYDDYAVSFGYKYCTRLTEQYDNFTEEVGQFIPFLQLFSL